MKIIAIVNHKGGVGKTTTTANLGKALALEGKKVLVIDIDPQANLSQSLGVESTENSIYHSLIENTPLPLHQLDDNFYLCPSDLDLSEAETKLQNDVNGYFQLKKLLKKQNFDYCLIDCPPSLGILTVNALVAATDLLIVVQAEFLAMKGLQNILDLTERIQENLNPELNILGMLITQLNNTVFRKSVSETVKDMYQSSVFETSIRQNIALAEATSQGKSIFEYAPDSNGAEDYRKLAKEILNK
ncbi:MAG: ParA family protein [Raineya sp.]|jgi:chromosome partitioning protein|nr:ParA family protein [Raineya sp.]